MKKLKLDISQLRVDSFDARSNSMAMPGTVYGQATGIGNYCTEGGEICEGTPTDNECLTDHCDTQYDTPCEYPTGETQGCAECQD